MMSGAALVATSCHLYEATIGRDEGLVDRARPVEADQLKDDRAERHGQKHGGDRRRDLHETARRQPLFKPDAHARPLSFRPSPPDRHARRP